MKKLNLAGINPKLTYKLQRLVKLCSGLRLVCSGHASAGNPSGTWPMTAMPKGSAILGSHKQGVHWPGPFQGFGKKDASATSNYLAGD